MLACVHHLRLPTTPAAAEWWCFGTHVTGGRTSRHNADTTTTLTTTTTLAMTSTVTQVSSEAKTALRNYFIDLIVATMAQPQPTTTTAVTAPSTASATTTTTTLETTSTMTGIGRRGHDGRS